MFAVFLTFLALSSLSSGYELERELLDIKDGEDFDMFLNDFKDSLRCVYFYNVKNYYSQEFMTEFMEAAKRSSGNKNIVMGKLETSENLSAG